jgi:hypothetical protein
MNVYEKIKQEISNMSVLDLTQAHTTSRSFQFPIATKSSMLQIIHRHRKSLSLRSIAAPHMIAEVCSCDQSYGGFGHLRRLDENIGMHA